MFLCEQSRARRHAMLIGYWPKKLAVVNAMGQASRNQTLNIKFDFLITLTFPAHKICITVK
jgi:hypothetical protein